MKTQYYHGSYAVWNKGERREARFTTAVLPPTQEEFKKFLNDVMSLKPDPTLSILMGIGLTHPKDQFVKKVGREVALTTSDFYKASFLSVRNDKDRLIVTVKTFIKHSELKLMFHIFKDTGITKIQHVYI
jgi:hypothetical protein